MSDLPTQCRRFTDTDGVAQCRLTQGATSVVIRASLVDMLGGPSAALRIMAGAR